MGPAEGFIRSGYWLLIVSDASTSAPEARRFIDEFSRSGKLEDIVRKIPEERIASRTGHWAAYYVAFDAHQDP